MATSNPSWWNDNATSSWDRAKEALRRDWEQTKRDLTGDKGRDLNQDAGDTLKQAAGKEAIPPRNVPNPPDGWDRDEPAIRYGYGAANYGYKDHSDWNDGLESKMKTEWNDLKSGRTWDEVKGTVKRGWESAKREVKSHLRRDLHLPARSADLPHPLPDAAGRGVRRGLDGVSETGPNRLGSCRFWLSFRASRRAGLHRLHPFILPSLRRQGGDGGGLGARVTLNRPPGRRSPVGEAMTQRFYITTPIYYLNAAPHVGHAYSTVVADALARYHRLRGHDTRFLTGTDEHGLKIQQAADKAGVAPQAHVDRLAEEFRQLWPKLNIEPDDFIRTTEPRHVKRVHDLWKRVAARGDIYLGHYAGWYCVSDEAFYTEKELIDAVGPDGKPVLDKDGKPVKLSPTKRPVEWVQEESYFFRLSKYQDRLLAFYEKHPEFIAPESRLNEVRRFVEGGLEDLSISRASFSWGIPVPGDEKHVIFVWFDALTNYWSALGDDSDPLQRFWPSNIHLVGKEITRFHAVYWPAFLMAAGFTDEQLPKQIFAHGWLTVNGEKMSKSANNFLPPLPIAERVGADTLRYYLLRAIALGQDGDFSHQDLLTRYNSELGNDLGNLLNRSLGLVTKAGLTATPAMGEETDLERALKEEAVQAAGLAGAAMEEVAPHKALEAIWAFCRAANVYVDRAAPWKAQKEGNTARVGTILATLMEASRQLSVLIAPFLPEKAAAMREQLGLPALAPRVDHDEWPGAWAPRVAGEALGKAAPLFPRLDEAQQKEILDALVPKPAEAPAPVTAAKGDKASGAAAPLVASEPSAPITYDQFSQVELKVGLVVAATKVPKKDKLLDLQVDVGEATPRRIVAGLALSFKPEELVGRRVIVVANLAPREFGKGLVSHGMLLATGPSEALSLIGVDDKAVPGSRVK